MDEMQKAFLKELDALFRKYGIERVRNINCIPMIFVGNGVRLDIRSYENGNFEWSTSANGTYSPQES